MLRKFLLIVILLASVVATATNALARSDETPQALRNEGQWTAELFVWNGGTDTP